MSYICRYGTIIAQTTTTQESTLHRWMAADCVGLLLNVEKRETKKVVRLCRLHLMECRGHVCALNALGTMLRLMACLRLMHHEGNLLETIKRSHAEGIQLMVPDGCVWSKVGFGVSSE